MKRIILLSICLMVTSCKFGTAKQQIKRELNIDVSKCSIEKDKDTHGGFLGDGDYIAVLDCNNNFNNMKKKLLSWNKLPLSENLQLIMYGGKKDGMEYEYNLALENKIPEIKNGYYYFINRHRDASSKQSDDIFNHYSFNFTLAMYDLDTNKLYYYKFDT